MTWLAPHSAAPWICAVALRGLITPRLSAAPRAAAPAAWRSSRPRVGASSLVSRFKPTQSFAPVPACLES